MRKKKKKLNKKRLFTVLGIIILIVLIIIMSNNIANKNKKEISLLLDNEEVKVKNKLLNEDGVIYLSKDDIEELFDSNIYYNAAEKELITTYNKHIAILKIDENFMIVNDSNAELKKPMIEKKNIVYVPFSEMGIIYDLEFEYSEDTKTLMADSLVKAKSKALTLRKYKVKEKPGIFAKNIEKVEQGQYVTIIEDASKKYYKIRTGNGNIGYMAKKRLAEPEKIRDDWYEEEISYVAQKDASNMNKNYSKVKLAKDKQNVVIPTFFYLGKNGEILDKTPAKTSEYEDYINWANANNVEVWVTLENNEDVSKLLRTYTDRNKVINDLYKKVVEYQFKGVNINFEKIDDVNSFNRFIIELAPRLKELGIKVAVKNNDIVDHNRLKDVVHLVIE